jgi:RimJ/RimL family protein N-acetyltransferase
MELSQVKIFSERLLLLPTSMKYKEDIFREFTEEITTYMCPRSPQDISDTELFITRSLENLRKGNELILVILKKNSQEFLGCTGIHRINSKYPEIGIWLKKSAHRNGYGLEAVSILKTWADDNLDYEYLIYPVDKANTPSRRIPQKLGGEMIREYDKTSLSGRVLNLAEYRIFRGAGG